jgi:hypothetical protein
VTNDSLASVLPTDASAATAPHLRGRWLVVARIGWIAAVLSAVAFYAATLPSYYAYLREVTPATPYSGCRLTRLTPAVVQTLHQLGLSADAFAWYFITVQLLVVLGWGAVGAVLFWRASADRVALLASLTLVLFTTSLYGPPGGPLPGWPLLPLDSLAFLGTVCIGLFFCVFPSGRFVPRWTPWLLLAWAASQGYDIVASSFPDAPLVRTPPDFAISVCLTVGLVAAQVYRYRRVSTPVQRQQTKWAVLGATLAAGGYEAAFLVFVVLPPSLVPLSRLADDVGYVAGTLPLLFMPLGIGIAVLRYRLFDIDVIIRRTLVYGSLTAILAGVYFGVVVGLQSLVTALTHQANPQPVFIVASTLLVAALFTPLRRRIQATIDRRFYRRKYDAAQTLAAFGQTLRSETDLAQLSAQLVAVVQETMQPAHVSLWLRPPQRPEDRRLPLERPNALHKFSPPS